MALADLRFLGGPLGAQRPSTVRELVRAYQEHRERHGAGGFRVPIEIQGMARSPVALRSGIDSSPCIYYEYRVERSWKRAAAEPRLPLLEEQDSAQGHDVLMAKRRVCAVFWLTDASSEVVVDPRGAEFDGETIVDRFERLDGSVVGEAVLKVKEFPFVVVADVEGRMDLHTVGFRYVERQIPLNRMLGIRALASDESGELALRRPPGGAPFTVRILTA